MVRIDYASDLPKHFVRTHCWLPACRQQATAVKNRTKHIPLRYFTFCAADAIDVFMLERAGVIQRKEASGRLEGVYFCERDPEDFGIIAGLIGSPEQGFQGEFDKIVLFEEDDETVGCSLLDDTPYTPELRNKLRLKDAKERFKSSFPFDIINLDVFGVMFPPRKGIVAPLLRSLLQILRWQTEAVFRPNHPCEQFTLLLTSHLDPGLTDQGAIEQLANRLNENLRANQQFQEMITTKYGPGTAQQLAVSNFAEFFCISLPKYILHHALFHLGWVVQHEPTYLYDRPDKYKPSKNYQIMHSVSVFKRIPNFHERLDAPGVEAYMHEAIRIAENSVKWVDDSVMAPDIERTLESDLQEIIAFRSQYAKR